MPAKKKSVISKASPHTIKKFELIEEYIKSWAQKLMLNDSCNGLIFIDCMCNSGIYMDDAGEHVKGTAVRVSEALLEVARTYTDKAVYIYLNDKDAERVDELEKHLPQNERNFQIVTSRLDAHELLKTIGPQLYQTGHLHYFLLYDPYDASIDWEAILPFFLNWGEVMINHMVFIVVRRDERVGYVIDILEPHSPDFKDNLGKAKGFAEYARQNPGVGRIQLIRMSKDAVGKNQFKRLDMNRSVIRDKVSHAINTDELDHIFDIDGIID